MLEDTATSTDFESDYKLRLYYKSCTNKELREELGVKPLQNMLKRLGGWPVLEVGRWPNQGPFIWHEHILKMLHDDLSIFADKWKTETGDDGTWRTKIKTAV